MAGRDLADKSSAA